MLEKQYAAQSWVVGATKRCLPWPDYKGAEDRGFCISGSLIGAGAAQPRSYRAILIIGTRFVGYK